MLRKVEALNFRCLRYISQDISDFQILVGPNASGKTTFLQVIEFLGILVSDGLEAAIESQIGLYGKFENILWKGEGDSFSVAIEAEIPKKKRDLLGRKEMDVVRYEVRISIKNNIVEIHDERVILKDSKTTDSGPLQPDFFPSIKAPPMDILTEKRKKGTQVVVNKVYGGNDNFSPETYKKANQGWTPSFKLGPSKSALGNLPDDEDKFPVAVWLKDFLISGISSFVLNSQVIRKPSPPSKGEGFSMDGSNLPWVIHRLRGEDQEKYRLWIEHIATALPDIVGVDTIEREEDRHRYLVVEYKNGTHAPSWVVSDGTLRLLALTLPSYLGKHFQGVYLIEEPENGIHPKAIETISKSLSSNYNAQILLATHSPVMLSMAETKDVLCFAKTDGGGTDIVRGDRHPSLMKWKANTDLGTLFASGILG